MRIVTDSRSPEEPKDPSDDLVFRLFSLVADGEKVEAMRGRYLRGGIGYAEAKEQLVAQLNETFGLARARYEELIDDRAGIDQILLDGADAARKRASPLLASVQTAVLGRTSKGSS